MTTESFVAMMPREMMQPLTRPLFAFQADVAKPSIIGMTPGGHRLATGPVYQVFEVL